jgi:hypothetical protein
VRARSAGLAELRSRPAALTGPQLSPISKTGPVRWRVKARDAKKSDPGSADNFAGSLVGDLRNVCEHNAYGSPTRNEQVRSSILLPGSTGTPLNMLVRALWSSLTSGAAPAAGRPYDTV